MLASLLRYRRRAARTDPHTARLTRPVISVGNISMGGRGKTPVAGLIARLLIDAGETPALLSRGYGRAIADDGVTVVSDGRSILADLAHSGDEPLMLARAVPGAAVLVCDQRSLAGHLAESVLGCTVHILDDGFQHHQLHRDIDIVIVTAEDLDDKVMPFGRLREPVDALSCADALLIDGKEPKGQRGKGADGSNPTAQLPNCPTASFRGRVLRSLAPCAAPTPGARVLAVAGIAGPERFFESLKAAGYTVAGSMGFKDHHRFSAADVARIGSEATRLGASAIVTTTKDAIRLEAFQTWPVPLVEIPLEVSVEPGDEFRAWLLGRLAEARA